MNVKLYHEPTQMDTHVPTHKHVNQVCIMKYEVVLYMLPYDLLFITQNYVNKYKSVLFFKDEKNLHY